MSGLDSKIQGFVHSLEQGGIARWIKIAALLAGIAAIALLYLFVEFKGLGEAAGMDQAQISRNLARGQGFTTNYIRPIAIWQFNKNGRELPRVSVPDTYHAPLNPLVNAIPLKLIQKKWKMSPQQVIYLGDRVIAAVSMLFFLMAVAVNFLTALRLFDYKLAALGTGLMLVCDLFWQYSLSGLPQMLMLFLFSGAVYMVVRAVQASLGGAPVGLWLGGAGVLFGLLALTHPITIMIFLGALLFVVLYFKPRFISGLLMLGFFLLVFSPWLARNFAVCGSPFGVGFYSALDGVQRSEMSWMRQSDPTFRDIRPGTYRGALQTRLLSQFNNLFENLGWSVVAPIFFVGLLHLFKRPDTAAMRWFLFSTWFFAVCGMVFFSGKNSVIAPAQLTVLFIPLMTYFGLAFLLVLWSRLPIDYRVVRIAFLSLVYFLCAIPMILTLLPGNNARIQWPPYVPPFIAILGDWMEPREVIATDMPWAVAWYADRRAVALPQSPADLTRMHDYEVLGGPINGLYLTPVTGNRSLFQDVIKGEYKEWASFILRSPAAPGFHLTAATALPVDNECIIFSDRDRWSRADMTMPDALKEKKPESTEGAGAPEETK